MSGQITALAVLVLLLIPGIAWAVLWSTHPDRTPKYQPRRSAGRQAAFQRNLGDMSKAIAKMVPAQMGAATKRAAEAMKRLGEQVKKGEDYRDGNM